MNKTTLLFALCLMSGISTKLAAQQTSPLSLRFHLQPQVSTLQPYDPAFISTQSSVASGFAFGMEATRSISKHAEISLGYYYSVQAGNYSVVSCDRAIGTSFSNIGFGARRANNCPHPRGRIRISKIPLSLGLRIIRKEKFMSRLSFGPQIQIILNPPFWGLYTYKKASLAFMTEWSNYFKLSKNLSLVVGLRADRGITPIDHNSLDRSLGNSMGLLVGAEYAIWSKSD